MQSISFPIQSWRALNVMPPHGAWVTEVVQVWVRYRTQTIWWRQWVWARCESEAGTWNLSTEYWVRFYNLWTLELFSSWREVWSEQTAWMSPVADHSVRWKKCVCLRCALFPQCIILGNLQWPKCLALWSWLWRMNMRSCRNWWGHACHATADTVAQH